MTSTTMAPPSLATSPPEVFNLVLEKITDKGTLLNLGLTNKFFLGRVFPKLYKDVRLRRAWVKEVPPGAKFTDSIRLGLQVLVGEGTATAAQFDGGVLRGFVESLAIEDDGIERSGICEAMCQAPYLSDELTASTAAALEEIEKLPDGKFEAMRGYKISADDRKVYEEKFNSFICDAVTLLPKLRRLELTRAVDLTNSTVDVIRQKGDALSELELAFTENMANYRSRTLAYRDTYGAAHGFVIDDDRSHISVSGFKNLTSLKLFRLYGDLARYIGEIAEVLVQNRATLREIGFSLGEKKMSQLAKSETDENEHDEMEEGWEEWADEMWTGIWHKLCARYVRKAIKLPDATEDNYDKLRIESLTLGEGFGMFMHYANDPDGKDVVAMALELSCLRKLKWENYEGGNRPEEGPDEDPNRGWTRLTPCDNLEDIEISYVQDNMVDDFFQTRDGNETKPIKRFVAELFEDEEDVPEYLSYILTEHLVHVQLPGLKMSEFKSFKDCKNLEFVKVDLRESDDDDEEEEDEEEEEGNNDDEDQTNPLRYLVGCEQLRTIIIGDLPSELEWQSYVEIKLNEGRWPHLEGIVLDEKLAERLKPFKVIRNGDGERAIEM